MNKCKDLVMRLIINNWIHSFLFVKDWNKIIKHIILVSVLVLSELNI